MRLPLLAPGRHRQGAGQSDVRLNFAFCVNSLYSILLNGERTGLSTLGIPGPLLQVCMVVLTVDNERKPFHHM